MSTMVIAAYDAFKAADATEEKATAATKAIIRTDRQCGISKN